MMSVQTFKNALMLSLVALLVYFPAGGCAGSVPLQDTAPSPGPVFERLLLAANVHAQFLEYGDFERHITLDKFGVGSAVEATFIAPNKGRVSVNLINEAEDKIILHVDARYNWYTWMNTLILNAYEEGVGWGSEQQPSGFDFTPGILVRLGIVADEDGFIIYNNGAEVGKFVHRQPVSSVKMVQMVFEDNDAEEKAKFVATTVIYGY